MEKSEIHNLMMLLGEIKGDLKSLHEKQDETLTQVKYTNGRVTALEHWKTGLMAKVSLIVTLITVAGGILLKKLGI